MKLDSPVQAVPKSSGIIIPEKKTVAGITGGAVLDQGQLPDLVMITTRITIGRRCSKQVPDLVYLAAGLI